MLPGKKFVFHTLIQCRELCLIYLYSLTFYSRVILTRRTWLKNYHKTSFSNLCFKTCKNKLRKWANSASETAEVWIWMIVFWSYNLLTNCLEPKCNTLDFMFCIFRMVVEQDSSQAMWAHQKKACLEPINTAPKWKYKLVKYSVL